MKYSTWMRAALLLLLTTSACSAVEFDADGATAGKWTMDLDAARKLAAENQLPILLDFSGSDWCGWCKVMEENVFTKPAWKAYAQDNLVMVLIDFPNDKSLVPEKYTERNNAMKDEYGIRGFPTFVVLDDDGITELGRLSSGREKTPESFQAELKNLFRFRPAEMAKYAATLSPDKQAAYRGLIDELDAQKAALKQGEKAVVEARSKVTKLKKDIKGLEEKILAFRVSQLGEDERKQFAELEGQLAEARNKLGDWIKTKPDKNQENMETYKAMQAEIQEIEKKLSQY
jgi:thioredoxin-related protein